MKMIPKLPMATHWVSLEELFLGKLRNKKYWLSLLWNESEMRALEKLGNKQVDKMLVSWDPLVGKPVASITKLRILTTMVRDDRNLVDPMKKEITIKS